MVNYRIDPLQDATEALRIARQGLPYFLVERLRKDPKGFHLLEAIDQVVMIGGTAHIEPPRLNLDDRQPDGVPAEGIYDSIFDDAVPARHLKDVWNGVGDVDDPLVPQDDYEHELVLTRLRENPEAPWPEGAKSYKPAKFIGTDYTTMNQPDKD